MTQVDRNCDTSRTCANSCPIHIGDASPGPLTCRVSSECGHRIAWEEKAIRLEVLRGSQVRKRRLLCERCFREGAG